MALAHGHAVACHQLPEKFYARIATKFFGHGPEPLLILGLDAELALPLWIEQVAIAARQSSFLMRFVLYACTQTDRIVATHSRCPERHPG